VFQSLKDLIQVVRIKHVTPGFEKLEIITHRGGGKDMRVVWTWQYAGPPQVYEETTLQRV
jgi:hypothetical protein